MNELTDSWLNNYFKRGEFMITLNLKVINLILH